MTLAHTVPAVAPGNGLELTADQIDQLEHGLGRLDDGYALFSTSTCGNCRVAERAMKNAGVNYSVTVLDTASSGPALAETLKVAMATERLSVPIIMTPDGRLLRNLAEVSNEMRGMGK